MWRQWTLNLWASHGDSFRGLSCLNWLVKQKALRVQFLVFTLESVTNIITKISSPSCVSITGYFSCNILTTKCEEMSHCWIRSNKVMYSGHLVWVSYHKWENCGLKRLTELPKNTMVNIRTRIQPVSPLLFWCSSLIILFLEFLTLQGFLLDYNTI